MSIINTIIAYPKDKILFEYSNYKGNFVQASRLIIERIPDNTLGYVTSGNRTFFYLSYRGIISMCLTEDLSKEHSLSYLYDIKNGILETKFPNGDLSNIPENGLKVESEIKDLISYYIMKPHTARCDNQSVSQFGHCECDSSSLSEFINKDYYLTVQPKEDTDIITHNINFNTIVSNYDILNKNLINYNKLICFRTIAKRWKNIMKKIKRN